MFTLRLFSPVLVLASLFLTSACGVDESDAPGADAVTSEEGALQAAAGSWTWQYSATVLGETYTLLKGGDPKGSCTAKSSAVIILRDQDNDGLGQRVYWRVQGGAWHICDNTGGDGSSKTCNVTNNRWIQYQFCMKNGSTIIACAPTDGFQT